MSRFLPILALPLLFVALPTAPAAPVPKHLMKSGPELYYPTRVGTKWTYENADGAEIEAIVSTAEVND